MKVFICQVCGHIEFNTLPATCPVCGVTREKFTQNDEVFRQSKEKSPEAEVKHVPAVTINRTCKLVPEADCLDVIVKIGQVTHPMEEKHFITFVDCYQDDKYISRVFLTPMNLFPAACFHLKRGTGKVTVVENCNVHGYWKTDTTL